MKRQSVGQRLAQLRREKAWREERDIDQTEIAKAIGIGAKKQSYISRWERGDVVPKDDLLLKLAEYYSVNVGWLRFGEGEKRPPSSTEVELEKPKARPIVAAAGAKPPRKR